MAFQILLVPLQNSTTNKYHLDGLALSINLPDLPRKLLWNDWMKSVYLRLNRLKVIELNGLSLLSEPMDVRNNSLGYLQGTLGYSYMCRQEQILTVGQNFSLNTFHLQVQPFGVIGNEFGAGSLIGIPLLFLLFSPIWCSLLQKHFDYLLHVCLFHSLWFFPTQPRNVSSIKMTCWSLSL